MRAVINPSAFAGRKGLTIPSSIFPYWWHHMGHTHARARTSWRTKSIALPRPWLFVLLPSFHVHLWASWGKKKRMKNQCCFPPQEWTDNLQCKGSLYHWTFQIQSGSGAEYIDGRKGIFTPSVCRPSRGDLLPTWVTLTELRHEWGGWKMDGCG